VAIDREKVLAAAQKYVEKKKYDRAVLEYQRIVQEDPNDARTLLKMGDLQLKMEAFADAIATYERVGKFYSASGFSLKAVAVYKQIREIIVRNVPQLEDKYAHITPKLAELYQQLGLTSDALAALDEVATRLQRQSRDAEAIEVFRKVVELDPTNPLPHLRLAEALSHGGDVDGAVAEFAVAADQLMKLGRREDALKVLERLLHHKPDPTHAKTAAEIFLARNAPNDGMQALAKLKIAFQANQRDLETLSLLARAFTSIGQVGKSIEVQKEMARIARDSGRQDVFLETLTRLQKIAPNDEGVKRLAGGSQHPSSVPPSVQSKASERTSPKSEPPADPDDSVEDSSSYEDVGDSDIEPQPVDPRLSRPAPSAPPSSEVVVESGYDVIEEVQEPATAAGSHGQIARILTDAASFRESGLYAKAIETLRIGIEIAPRAIEAHEMLRDVLLDAGLHEQAVGEMIALASLLVEALDGEAAARMLQDALAIDPSNATAAQMLQELGYELVEESDAGDVAEAGDQTIAQAVDAGEPLPSYDLEEIGPEDVARRSHSEASIRTIAVAEPAPVHAAPAAQAAAPIEMDDPFADSPLPSFPLEPAADSADAVDPFPPERHSSETLALQSALSVRPSAKPGPLELESALEEAEFFASRGLYDDARSILDEQLARLPNHPLLMERLAELETQERGMQGESGTRPSPGAGSSSASAEDRSFDIAESLGSLEAEPGSGVGVGAKPRAPTEQVDVEEVFAQFKAGVAKQIDVDDAQSHYDLGVAYREMGLLDDAVREFEVSGRDPKRACVCYSMIGTIRIERGDLNGGIDALMRALQSPDRTKDQEATLTYEIGAAYEAKKMNKQAVDFFQRSARAIPSFRDTAERIRRLQKPEPKPPVRAAAVGADDEFDRAFDDILGQKEAPQAAPRKK
jgi:tetratricopeptide (TPR) repeat protein